MFGLGDAGDVGQELVTVSNSLCMPGVDSIAAATVAVDSRENERYSSLSTGKDFHSSNYMPIFLLVGASNGELLFVCLDSTETY